MEHADILWALAGIFGFYMAWNIGANDVANAMGTSVGSGALTLRRAVIVAAVLEFAGAFLAGSKVSDTVRKGIVDADLFSGDPTAFICGMLAALLAAGAWLQIASYYGWPVSTTHSIVGAIIGFGILYAIEAPPERNLSWTTAIHWPKVGQIVSSWVISPLLSATISYLTFKLLLKNIFYQKNPLQATKRLAPLLVFIVMTILTLTMVFKGLKNIDLDLELGPALLISMGVGFVSAIIAAVLVRRIKVTDPVESSSGHKIQYQEQSLQKARKHLRRLQDVSDAGTQEEIATLLKGAEDLGARLEKKRGPTDNPALNKVEKIFIYLQILSACFVAFAHGSNDVANAIGPLSAVLQTIEDGKVALKSTVAPEVLALGGLGIIIGLATWGWRVMETVGRRITELTPSRGFTAEFAAATTIVLATKLGLPISTTHTLVGAVVGVGLARGMGALNLNTVRDIAISWVITVPAGAIFAMIFYKILMAFFG
ncbi:MAG: inorganic phosphate transporter [Planctomycetes bacterium]|jgi:PiT family inorganic phosphate transporter|nr:inorganic phosphate transporter [Planctomycetota bacterium]MBT7131294.1 inorganic phosphate transporter [Planctomycetota bacterium]MBT7640691.1 inorganic phosphate transporter [Planctomycetota bacterium]